MSEKADQIIRGDETAEELVAKFQQLSLSGADNSLGRFLQAITESVATFSDADRHRLLNDLAIVDMKSKRSQVTVAHSESAIETALTVDVYVSILASHNVQPDCELIAEEFRSRIALGEDCKPSEFQSRFAQHWDELQPMLVAISLQHELSHLDERQIDASQIETSNLQDTMPNADCKRSPDQIPEQIGRFKIIRRLGRGGMGDVLLAEDPKLDRQVALKLPRFASDDYVSLQRFLREAKLAAALDHPNLCPIYDIGNADGDTFICMGYVEGETVGDMVRRDGPVPVEQAVEITKKLATVLSEAHDAGILHRDMKPGNVMIDHRGEVILMDFGLATHLDSDADAARLTTEGTSLGSPAYMSPEQVSGASESYGPPTDVYGLGACLYEMLVGRPPFVGSVGEVLASAMSKVPERPRKHRDEISGPLDAVAMKMLAKDSQDRFPTMDAVASALESLSSSTDAETKTEPSFWSPARIAIAVASSLAAMLLAGLIYLETGKGTVQLNVKDPECKVSIDGNEITIVDGDMKTHRIYPGDHTLDIRRGDMQFETQQFSLKRRGKVLFDVKLVDETLTLSKNGDQLAERELARTSVAESSTPESGTSVLDSSMLVQVTPDGRGETLTLAEALDQAKPGQTLNLATGEYPIGSDLSEKGVAHYRIKTPDLTIKGNRSRIKSSIDQGAPNLILMDLECWMVGQGQIGLPEYDFTMLNCRTKRLNITGDAEVRIENCVIGLAGGYKADITIDHCTLTGSYENSPSVGNEFYFSSSYDVRNSIIAGVDNAFVTNSIGAYQVRFENCLLYSPTDSFILFSGTQCPQWIADGTPTKVPLANATRLQGFEFADCIFNQDPKFLRLSMNGETRDCRLRVDSPAIGKATEGKDIGAIADADGWPLRSLDYSNMSGETELAATDSQESLQTRFWTPDASQQEWIDSTSKLPIDAQIDAVKKMMVKENPGFNGEMKTNADSTRVT